MLTKLTLSTLNSQLSTLTTCVNRNPSGITFSDATLDQLLLMPSKPTALIVPR